MIRAIKDFSDLQDHSYVYRAGDVFPRPGITVSEERIVELSSSNNARREPLIVVIPDTKEDISLAKETTREIKTGEKPSNSSEAKGKQKKGHGKHA